MQSLNDGLDQASLHNVVIIGCYVCDSANQLNKGDVMNFALRVVILYFLLSGYGAAQEILNEPPELNVSVEARANAKRTLSTISEQSPSKVLDGVMFFSSSQSIETALQSVDSSNLKIEGFRHGTSESSGGYKLGPNESFQEAAAQYRNDYSRALERDELFTQRIINQYDAAKSPLESDKQSKIAQAAQERLNKIRQRRSSYEEHGIRIIGLEFQGEASVIEKYWEANDSGVSTIEIKRKGLPVPNRF